MLLSIVIILLVAYIVIPLIELITNPRAQFAAKVVVYILAFVYVLWLQYFSHAG